MRNLLRFTFNADLKKEFLGGRSVTYVADAVGYSRNYIAQFLNGHKTLVETSCWEMLELCVNVDSKSSDAEDIFDKYFIEVER